MSFAGGFFFLKETLEAKREDKIILSDSHSDEERMEKTEPKRKVKKRILVCKHLFTCFYVKKKVIQLWKIAKALFLLKILTSMFLFGMAPFTLVSAAEVIILSFFDQHLL